MTQDLRFLPEIPEGMCIFVADNEVAGVQYRISNARAFASGKNQMLELVPEPHNQHDANAIKVIGIYKGWFVTHRVHIGYVPADVAELIADREISGRIYPRLRNIWWGGYTRDFIVVRFDILEPKTARPKRGEKGVRLHICKEKEDANDLKPKYAVPERTEEVKQLQSGCYQKNADDVRRLSRHLRFLILKKSARASYDLMCLGSGTAERLCASLILGSVFFGGFLTASVFLRLGTVQGLLLASMALVVVFIPSAILILGPSDAALEKLRVAVRDQLAAARLAEAAQKDAGEFAEPTSKARETDDSDGYTTHERTPISVIRETGDYPHLASTRPRKQRCPYCAEIILAKAIKCKHCGEILDEDLRELRERSRSEPNRTPMWSPGVAAVLSLVIPGAGQMYKGQILNGLAWLFLVCVGYLFCLAPGILLHLFCILGAASGDPYRG